MRLPVILLALALAPSLAADEWTPADTAREATYLVLHVIDWGQTLDIVGQEDRYHEINPILGEHPSRGRVNLYMATTPIVHGALAYALPRAWREGWQYVTIGIEGNLVYHNYRIGLHVDF